MASHLDEYVVLPDDVMDERTAFTNLLKALIAKREEFEREYGEEVEL